MTDLIRLMNLPVGGFSTKFVILSQIQLIVCSAECIIQEYESYMKCSVNAHNSSKVIPIQCILRCTMCF